MNRSLLFAALAAAVSLGALAEGESATVAKFVDWIGSTGTQRINTGVVPDKRLVIETDYIAGDYAPYVRQENKALFGTGWNEYLLEQREGLGFRASSTKTKFTKPEEGDECTFTLAKGGALSFSINGAVDTEATINAAYTGSSPIYLFGAGNVNNYNSIFKLRRFVLAKDGAALRYLVPCVDTEDRPGLFDTVSGTILYDVNESATVFTVPEEEPTRTDARVNAGAVEVAVAAIAGEGATVTGPTGWVALGNTLTFTAEVPDGMHFFKWTDAAGNSYYDNPYVVAVNAPIDLTLTPHFGTSRYVEYSDSFDDYGDGSEGSPYSSIKYALTKAADGDTILLKTGTYQCKEEALVEKGVTITSATGDRKDVTLKLTGDNSHRVMRLNHPDARLACVTINGDNKQAQVSGAGVCIDAQGGTVDHCEIFNCKSYAYGHVGGGIYIAAGSPALVDSVIISNCTSHCEGPYGGAALFMTSADAKVVNSLFLKNTITGSQVACGAVKIENGLLKNCTIALNHITQCSGVWATGGRVVDCIIAENTHPTARDAKSITWAGTASCFSNCVGTAKINDFCFEEAHPFRDAANYDFTPVPSSAAVDKASAESWMGATDFVGNPRIMGAAPDIGAVEMDPTELSASFAVDVDAGFAPLNVNFSVTATGIETANLACLWDWNGDGTVDETTYGLAASHQFAACFASVGLTVSNTVTGATYAVPVKVAIKSVGETVYVRKESETPVAPYDTWEKAAATISDALSVAIDGCTVVLSNGTHQATAESILTSAVKVRGLTGDSKDVTVSAKSSGYRLFQLANAEAEVSGLTITGSSYSGNGAGVFINTDGGTVSNCLVRNCGCSGYGQSGGGIYIAASDAALVDSVVITNCKAYCEGGSGGNAICMAGGTVRNSLFMYNTPRNIISNSGGTVKITGGRLVNCTITLNSAAYRPGVWASGDGKVVSCIIAENKMTTGTDPLDQTWTGTASCFENCVASKYINDDCFTEEHPFTAIEVLDLTPSAKSAAFNGAEEEPWMVGAVDIMGNPRVSGPKPDIGAVEADANKFSAEFEADASEGFSPLTVNYTVSANGASAEEVVCYWDWNGDGVYDDEITEGLTATHIFEDCAADVGLLASNKTSGATYVVPSKAAVKSVEPTLYVVQENPNAQVPYATWETAAASLNAAAELSIGGCTIIVSNGTHEVTGEIFLEKSVKVRGVTGDPDDVTLKAKGKGFRMFHLKDAEAEISAVTITGAKSTSNGAGVYFEKDGGTVSNAVIANCSCTSYNGVGAGIYIVASSAALVDSVVITNCDGYCEGSGGTALCMAGGTVRNSLFMYNTPNHCDSGSGGTVKITGGRLESCTIALNKSAYRPGVVASGDGRVVSCIIAGNARTNAVDPLDQTWTGTASCFENCVASIYINDSCFVEVDPFVDVNALDLTPTVKSKAFNGADEEEWMTGAKDILGNPRVVGKAPDIGAVESQVAEFSADFDVEGEASGFAPHAVSFKVSAAGAEDDELICYWNWGDGKGEEEIEGAMASHAFDIGSYEVKLRVVNRTTGDEVAAPSVVTVTALGKVLYVKKSNAAPKLPYDNWDNAATNLEDAVAIALDGCEIVVAEDEYPVSAEILVAKRLDIHGAGRRDATVFNAVGTGHRIFHLAHANAKIANLTASGASAGSGAGIYIGTEGGCVSNVLVRNCFVSGYGCRGAGIYVANSANALVDSAVVSNCTMRFEGTQGGTALSMDGGMVRNCLFTQQGQPTGGDTVPGGTVHVAGGELVNCTIAGNESFLCAGVWLTGGNVVNCLIGDNVTTHENQNYAVFACDETLIDRFDHCMAPVRISKGSFEGHNLFRNAAAGDYRLWADSPARDKGVNEGWMTGARDLCGGIRVTNRKVDIGAYEYQAVGFSVIVR